MIVQFLFRRALSGARERIQAVSLKLVLGALGKVVLLPQRRFVVELAGREDAAEPLPKSHGVIVGDLPARGDVAKERLAARREGSCTELMDQAPWRPPETLDAPAASGWGRYDAWPNCVRRMTPAL